LNHLAESEALASKSLIIVEHSVHEPVPDSSENWTFTDQRRYGKTLVSFYSCGM